MKKTKHKYTVKAKKRIPLKNKSKYIDAINSLEKLEKIIKPFHTPTSVVIDSSEENWSSFNTLTHTY